MADIKRDAGLRTIFSFFLGLILTAFVGVGVYTFHAPPDQLDARIHDLARREAAIRNGKPSSELPAADQERLIELDRQRTQAVDASAQARKPWGRSTSVILIALATLAMAVSLVRADQLPVISNGLLLGGLFTMLYGVGWIVVTDASIARFLVMTAALAITLGLGYVRFVRRGPVAATGAEPSNEGLDRIESRVRDLEERLNHAAQALGQNPDAAR